MSEAAKAISFSMFCCSLALAQTRETTITKEKTKDGKVVSSSFQKSTEVLGRPITSKNQNVGKVEDLVIDANSGRVVYGVASFNNVKGGTERLYPIPYPATHYSTVNRTYSIDLDPARLEAAPSFTVTEWPNFTDEGYAVRTFKTYNVTPWWEGGTTFVRTSDTGPSGEYTETWTERPANVYRISEIRGRVIFSPEGIEFGTINDVVLDPESGRVDYVMVAREGQIVPIPWIALHARDKGFELALSTEEWRNAPVIETERWTTLSEPQTSERVHSYYKVKHKVKGDKEEHEIKTKVKHEKKDKDHD